MSARPLLICGILSSVLYAAMNILVPIGYEGYSTISQTVSELSAIGAPTRQLWVGLGLLYASLTIAFGWGVWKSAGGNWHLRVAGALVIANGIISLYWPPMHVRGALFTLTDLLHIVWSAVTVILFLLTIAFAAAALDLRFRLYSVATILILLVFGVLTGREAPRIAADLPTPWIGIWERISIAAFMLWVIVLAVILLRRQNAATNISAGSRGIT